MLDYEVLRIIWWLLLGVLLTGFAIMDGFDLGAAMLLPFAARSDIERRTAINSIGPVWEGNQVWIILGAGAIFAAWPYIYAVTFSGFYLAMFLALIGFIMRPVGFKYRSKIEDPKWRAIWDWVIFLGGFIPALVFGIAIGNVIQGVPFHFDDDLRNFYTGTLFGLFNPFALLCGVISVLMLLVHGGLYLAVKTDGAVRERSIRYARIAGFLLIIGFALAGIWVIYGIKGFLLTGIINPDGPSNPLHKEVILQTGAWINNFSYVSWLWLVPALGFIGILLALALARVGKGIWAFLASSVGIIGIVATVGVSMFPFILPSSSNPSESLLVWDASSSQLTLFIMLLATLIFMPIILIYTAWVYRILRGKVSVENILANDHDNY